MSKDSLRIGIARHLLMLFQKLYKLENSYYIDDSVDIEYAFMSAKYSLINALVHKIKSTNTALGFEQYSFHGTLS